MNSLSRTAVLCCALLLGAASCGTGESQPEQTLDDYFRSFSYDYEPADDSRELRDRSEVVVVTRVVSIDDGSRFGDPPSADDASRHLRLNLESALLAEPIVIELPRPPFVSVESIRGWLPLKTEVIVFVNRSPRVPEAAQEFWENRPSDLWQLASPQGFVLNLPDRGWYQPLTPGPREGFDGDPLDAKSWLPDGSEFVAE